ncbi:MAG: hypothetical protein ACRYE8_03630 [Janthinobacterium lividum]
MYKVLTPEVLEHLEQIKIQNNNIAGIQSDSQHQFHLESETVTVIGEEITSIIE